MRILSDVKREANARKSGGGGGGVSAAWRGAAAHKSLLNLERHGYAVCRVIYQDSLPNITVE